MRPRETSDSNTLPVSATKSTNSNAGSARSPKPSSTPGNHTSLWGLVATLLIAAAMVFVIIGFPVLTDYSKHSSDVWPDVLHERATAWEALHGDPYRPISEIMPEHGYPEMSGGFSPRTPAALLGQVPLLLIPDGALMPAVTVTIAILVTLDLWLAGRIAGVEWAWLSMFGPLLFVSLPVVTSVIYGSVSVVAMTTLILGAWAYRDRDWAALPLGIAAAMRLWPGLVIVGFWVSGRRRVALIAVAVFVAANAAGLLLPAATVDGSFQALLQGGGAWLNHNQNASLAPVLSGFGVPAFITTLLVSALALALSHRRPFRAIAICVVAALLASPLSWPAYLLVTLPVMVGWARSGGLFKVLALSSPLVLWMFTPTRWKGHIAFFILVVLLGYSFLGAREDGLASSNEPSSAMQ